MKRGIVRFRSDPLKLGRIKVEIIGVHAKGENVDNLPWVYPVADAWDGGGTCMIPPVGSGVIVLLEDDDHHYPRYLGGWWGQKVNRPPVSGIRWETGMTGATKRHTNNILNLEPGARPENAPDGFGMTSGLCKRVFLDDRAGKQKAVLADQIDNGLLVNSETGSLALESSRPLSREESRVSGLLLDSGGPRGRWQLHASGYLLTCDPNTGVLELQSLGGHKIRIDDSRNEVGVFSNSGHSLMISDSDDRIELRSVSQRGVTIDDRAQTVAVHGSTTADYVLIDESNGLVDIRSGGDIRLAAGGNILLAAEGQVVIDGETITIESGSINNVAPTIGSGLNSRIVRPDVTAEFPKPY